MKVRPIVGTTENLDLLSSLAANVSMEANNTAAYYAQAIGAARKKLAKSLTTQKAAKQVLRRRNQFPSEVGKIMSALKEQAAFEEIQIRAELTKFKEQYNGVREMDFIMTSALKLVEEKKCSQ